MARKQCGFTLLEVLVAILILSFGVLGAAGMQAAALQANKQARLQANATQLAHQLTDLMRANNAVAKATSSNPFLLDNVNSTLPTYTVDCTTTNCTDPVDSAKWAVAGWLHQLQDASNAGDLPGAKVIVCFDDLPFDATTGKAKWACSSTAASTTLYIKLAWTTAAIGNGGATPANPAAPQYQDTTAAPFLVLPVIPG